MSEVSIAKKSLAKNDWPLVDVAGLRLIRSPLLGQPEFDHAFTTRVGGKTREPLDSFNLGRHITEPEFLDDAMVNRRRLCEALKWNFERLLVPGQRHTTNIFITECSEGSGTAAKGDTPSLMNFDGVISNGSAQPLMLHFADCVPIILYSPESGKYAVVHAGWRGTAGGIVKNAVQLMAVPPGSIFAAIGPAIGSCCYETGTEVSTALSNTVSNPEPLIEYRNEKPHPDLKAFNAMQLYEAGVNNVDVTSWCTACHPDLFYSHRKSGGFTGRQAAVACRKV